MSFQKTIYYCIECKKVVNTLPELLFVEDQSEHGFCSEECIEDFFNPLILYFDQLEKKTRGRLNLTGELIKLDLDDKNLIEDVFKKPTEIYKISNELNQKFYRFFKRYQKFTAVVTTLIFNNEPSFIFQLIKTSSDSFLDELKLGELVQMKDESHNRREFSQDEELIILENLENKKSKLLAELIINRDADDISIEDFSHYDYCLYETMNSPDEIFEIKDNEGDLLYVYTKSFINEKGNFFYVIYSVKSVSPDESSGILPFFSFPTKDLNFFSTLKNGHRVQGQLKN